MQTEGRETAETTPARDLHVNKRGIDMRRMRGTPLDDGCGVTRDLKRLRNSCASILLAQGVPVRNVAEILGAQRRPFMEWR